MKIEIGWVDELKNNLDDKLKNPFWWSMIATWLTWNWKIWYVTFFVSHKELGIEWNKIDYIKDMYNYFDYYIFFPFLWFIFNWILMPLFLSWFIIIFVTPKISHWFLDKHRANKKDENKKDISALESLNNLLDKEKEVAIKTKNVEKIKEKSEEEKWDEDYSVLTNKQNNLIPILEQLIYHSKGNINDDDWNRSYDVEIESLLDVNWLIESIWEYRGAPTYKITPKWKYFLSK